jgi:transcription antitermination factor NusG
MSPPKGRVTTSATTTKEPSFRSAPYQPWYAIHTQGRWEHVASSALREKGYEEYLPLCKVKKRWSDRQKTVDMPLFPGYLFCRLDISQSTVPILTSPGVMEIVRAGRSPVPVPEEDVEAVRTVLRSGLAAFPWPGIVAGARVLVERGPLAGLEGAVLEIRKQCRLVISVPLLGRGVAVDIDGDWVRLLPASETHKISSGSRRSAFVPAVVAG